MANDISKMSTEEIEAELAQIDKVPEPVEMSTADIEKELGQLEQPIQKNIVTDIPMNTEISATPKSIGRMKPMTIEEVARTQNIGAISRSSGQRLSEVASQYQGKTPETGVKRTYNIGMYRDPTSKQLAQAISDPYIKSTIAVSAITNPVGTVLGLAMAIPVFKGIDWAVQKGEEGLPENTPPELKEMLGVGGYLASLYAGGKVLNRFHRAKPVTQLEGMIKNTITKSMYKAKIKPAPSELPTYASSKDYEAKVQSAVGQIYNNKDNLVFTDIDSQGRPIQRTGLPQNISDLVQAIPQVKKSLWNKVADVYQNVGDKKFTIGSKTMAKELLTKTFKDKVLRLRFPSAYEYAREKAKILLKDNQYTPNEIEDFIASTNKQLSKLAYSKEPVPEEVGGKIYIDAVLADIMRNNLDVTVQNAGELSMKPLRKQYADLKTLEKYANKTYAKTTGKASGLLDYFNAYTIGDILSGIATGNLPQAIRGTASNVLIRAIKSRNHPDNIIKGMFRKVDSLNQQRLISDELNILDLADKPYRERAKQELVLKKPKLSTPTGEGLDLTNK